MKEVMQNWTYFFLKYLVAFTNEAIWVWGFLCGFLTANLIFKIDIRRFRFFIFVCVSLGNLHLQREIKKELVKVKGKDLFLFLIDRTNNFKM